MYTDAELVKIMFSKEEVLELKLATIYKKVLETKWYQFRKRRLLYKEADKLHEDLKVLDGMDRLKSKMNNGN